MREGNQRFRPEAAFSRSATTARAKSHSRPSAIHTYAGSSAGIVINAQLRKLHCDIGSAPGWNALIATIAAVNA